MIYIGFDTLTNKYKAINSEKDVATICSECNFTGELYRLLNFENIEILNPKTFEFIEFRALFANPELFRICKKYFNQDFLRHKYLYHHTIDEYDIKNILKQGLRKRIGEVYQDFLNSYLDEFKYINDFSLPKKYYQNINNNHLVKGIFLCSDTDYNLTDADYVIKIDRSYISNIYRDFNETSFDCYFTTDNIPIEAIISIKLIDEDGTIIETIYEK